jgi:hypothetical protein
MSDIEPHSKPATQHEDVERLITAVEQVMRPGGWLSGPCPPARPSAPLPEFNPSVLVLDVQRLLAERGITVVVDLGNANTATIAPADLLRALGVAPASAPTRAREAR